MKKPWSNEAELFQIARKQLFSAVIGDTLDQFGHHDQFLPADIKPISREMVVAGRVMTVLGTDIHPEKDYSKFGPYGLLFESLDALRPDEVYLSTGGTPNYAIWGGLMSTRATQLRAAGAIVDGCYRDSREILALNFPTFARAAYAPDQQGRGLIIDYRCTIEIDGVCIENGDFVFGDVDGVVILPQKIAEDVLLAAYEKSVTENKIRDSILKGMSATEAFEKYGIF